MSEVAPWVLPILTIVCFLASILIYGAHYQIFNWPYVEGVVTKSVLIREFNPSLNGRDFLILMADIEYEYEVDGEEFVGYKVSSTQLDANVDIKAPLTVRRFPVGHKGRIYYDKSDPERSVLVNIFPTSIYFFIFWCIVFAVFQEILFPDFYLFEQF